MMTSFTHIPPREFYTAQELAQMLRVTEMTIYRMAKRGQLPFYSIGRSMRFRAAEVEAFLQTARGQSPSSSTK
jgi:excisionase family DNA binding protein